MSSQVLNAVSFARETTWGTPVTPDKSMPVNFTGGLQTQNDIQFVEGVTARLAANQQSFVGNRTHEGDLEFSLNPDYSGYFLLTALGDVSSALAAGETIVYDHTFTEAATKPSLTIEQAIGDNVRRYAGAITSTFSIAGSPGEVVTATASMQAKGQASATAITPAYTDTRPYNFVDAVVKFDTVKVDEMQAFTIEYANNLGLKYVLNSNDPQFQYVNGSTVSGSFEMYLDTATLAFYNNYLAKTSMAIDLELTGDAIGVAENEKFNFSIPKAVFTTAETPLGNDYNMLTIEFEGEYDTATSSLCSASLTNLLADYS